MVLFVHNRYRTIGGEERVVADLEALVREQLHQPAELFAADSRELGRARAAQGLLAGGLGVTALRRRLAAGDVRVLHAHNLPPAFGWRHLQAARAAGVRVVLHLHQYRLVCAIGVCFTEGAECTRCHGRNTLPGLIHNCRASRAEGLAYAAALALWQRRMVELADVVLVPSAFAAERLLGLGAHLPQDRLQVLAPPLSVPAGCSARIPGDYALLASRLAPEKGVEVAIEACRRAGMPLVIAGDGPERRALEARVAGSEVRFEGQVDAGRLSELRAGAAIALAPSRSAETFGLAVAEALADALPVLASRVGALPELLEDDALVPAGDAEALAAAIPRMANDLEAGARGRERVRELCSPERVAGRLERIYAGAVPSRLPGWPSPSAH